MDFKKNIYHENINHTQASAFITHKMVSVSSAEGEHNHIQKHTLKDGKKAKNLNTSGHYLGEKKKKNRIPSAPCLILPDWERGHNLPIRENNKIGACTSIENVKKRNNFPKQRTFKSNSPEFLWIYAFKILANNLQKHLVIATCKRGLLLPKTCLKYFWIH